MRSFGGSLATLAVTILFLEVGKWSNGEAWASLIRNPDYLFSRELSDTSDNSTCSEVVSHKISHYVPYTETFRTRSWGLFHQIKTRVNFRLEYHTVWRLERKCCEGYRQIGVTCKPHCAQPCEKGKCVKPNVCVCNAGYVRGSNDTDGKELCLPVCANDCINGTCIEPDICSCDEGYWMGADGFTCRPACPEECERNNAGYCPEPHVCSCRTGYRSAESDPSRKCVPVCDRECTNGHCAAPNVCRCADGYVADEFDSRFTCVPRCSETCVFGACTAPETCTCDHGYAATVNASLCEPVCAETCEMGVCVAPESCRCDDGYGLLGNSTYVCEPICETDCGNGACIAPGVCSCNEGFFYDERGDRACKPRCEIPCGPNGGCTSPDNCTCFEGYRAVLPNESAGNQTFLNDTREPRSICRPVCDFECVNGECTAPNVCTCVTGYHPSWIESHQRTLSLDNSTARICEPVCVSCGINGICIAPDVCACKDGYEDTDGNCAPLCSRICFNGTCTAPDRCKCDDGYAPRNESVCEPICENGCENGDCVAPNRCACRDSYVRNNGYDSVPACVPACTRNCSGHGVCVVDDEYRCECHYGWTGRECDRPTVCVITIGLDSHDDINRITVRNDTNSTIMRAHENAPYCYQRENCLNNESLCYVVHPDEANVTSTVGCLLSTDLPCYTTPHYNATSNVTEVVWLLTVVAVLTATSLTVAAYLMYRRHQKKKTATGNPTAGLMRDSFASESLLSENAIYL